MTKEQKKAVAVQCAASVVGGMLGASNVTWDCVIDSGEQKANVEVAEIVKVYAHFFAGMLLPENEAFYGFDRLTDDPEDHGIQVSPPSPPVEDSTLTQG